MTDLSQKSALTARNRRANFNFFYMIITKQMAVADDFESKDTWETPDHIFKKLSLRFQFDLDPCCTEYNAKCEYYFTQETNGLNRSWKDYSVFVNPPYSRGNIDLWVEKCFNERKDATVVALLPVSTSADWFQKYCIGQTIYWVDKRVRFVGAPYTAPFSSMIVYFNDENKNLTFKQTIA